jgi:hypothetical protein
MSDPSNLPLPTPTCRQPLATIAGPPPLTASERERAAGYDELLARMIETLQPSDVLEHIWIRDVVDEAWEVFRLRRLKVDLMTAATWEGMAKVLEPWVSHPEEAGKMWARRDRETVQRAEAALAASGWTADHVAARTFALKIAELERISRMLESAEGRRNAALREIDLHRAKLAVRLRHTLQAVEDVEFKVVEPAASAQEGTAEAGTAEVHTAEAANSDVTSAEATSAEAA